MADRPEHDWFIADWLRAKGVKQVDLQKAAEWSPAKASDLVSGKQPYKRDTLNQAAAFLNIEPYELLMHPADAHALKQFRAMAVVIARPTEVPAEPVAEPVPERRAVSKG